MIEVVVVQLECRQGLETWNDVALRGSKEQELHARAVSS